MDAATRNLQQFYQLKLELLKAVDEISRVCEEGGLEDKVLTDRVLDLMHQTVHSARLTVHYITALGDTSINLTSVSVHTSETHDNRENKVLRKRASSSPVMRREGPNGVGPSPRSPKNWRKVSKISAFSDSSTGCDSSIDVGRGEISPEDENSNHSSNSSRRNFSHDDSNFVDEEVVSKFLEPCMPCSRSSSRAADTSSFLEASVSSIDTSNVSVRRKRKKKDDSAESSIEDLLPETLPSLHSDSLSLAVLGCNSPATPAPSHQLTFCQRSASPLQLTPSLCQRTASPLHLSSAVCSRMTSPAGQLTPPASESGQGSPKSVDSDKLEADSLRDAIIAPDVVNMSSVDVTSSKHIPTRASIQNIAAKNNTDVFTPSQLNINQQSQSNVISYRPYLQNGCTSSLNYTTMDCGSSNGENVTATDITLQIERLDQVKSRDKKSGSTPKKVSAGRRNSARISSGSRSSPRKPVPRIEVISIDCSSDDEMYEEEEFITPQTKCVDKEGDVETPTRFEESTEILPGTKQSHQRIQSSSKKKHLNFKEVCQINESMFDTPELLRGAESWKDWRINSPVEGTRNLNTPLECSTPLSIQSNKIIADLESKSDDDEKKGFHIKEVVMRQPNLRVTPARIKYSSKIKEINQDKGRKLIVLSDTRLKDNFDSKENSEDSQEEEEITKQKKQQNKIKNTFMSDSNLMKLTGIPKPESINRTDTPVKKKTLARSKASVSLVKPNESPPSTPKRRGRPDKQMSVSSVISKIPVIEEEDDSVNLNLAAKDNSSVTTTTAKYKVPDFKNPFCNLRKNVSRSRAGLQATKEKHISSSVDIKAKSSDRPKLIRASASVAKLSVPSKSRNGCSAVSNNDNVPVISTKLIKTMAEIFEKQSDSAPSKTDEEDMITKDNEAAISDTEKQRTTKVVFSDNVDVFYFKRIQGWLSVPKEGGNTLGMEYFHHSEDKVKLSPEHDNHDEHSVAVFEPDELEPAAGPHLSRRNKFPRIENVSDREAHADLENDTGDHFYGGGNIDEYDDFSSFTATRGKKIRTPVRSDSTPCLLEASKLNGSRAGGGTGGAATGSLLDLRAAVVSSNINKKGECGTRGLYRISSRARKTLLKKDGIKELDTMEALEAKFLRESRMEVGCSCSGECKPGVCECVEAGIQCQEERRGFPCSCSVGCTNPAGIKRFDPTAVKMHLIQTMLEIQVRKIILNS